MSVIQQVPSGATVSRFLLGHRLEQLRSSRRLTLREVAGSLYLSDSKLCRIERGEHRATVTEIESLADHYGVCGRTRDTMLRWGALSQGRGLYHSFADVADARVRDYLDVEAVGLRAVFAPRVIPAVLRTRRYAVELLGAMRAEEVERRLWLLALRQQRLWESGRGPVRVLLAETVLDLGLGGPGVMDEQTRRLRDVPVQVRVLPAQQAARVSSGAFSWVGLGEDQVTLAGREREDGRPRLHPDRQGRAAARFEELWRAGVDLGGLATVSAASVSRAA